MNLLVQHDQKVWKKEPCIYNYNFAFLQIPMRDVALNQSSNV